MAFGSKTGSFKAPGAPTKVPAPGGASAVGMKAPALPKAPAAKIKNTRDYGKQVANTPPASPFGSDSEGIF